MDNAKIKEALLALQDAGMTFVELEADYARHPVVVTLKMMVPDKNAPGSNGTLSEIITACYGRNK